MRSLEKILHPQKETLQFPAELGEVKDALKELRQLIGKLAPNDDPEEESADEDEVGLELFLFHGIELYFFV